MSSQSTAQNTQQVQEMYFLVLKLKVLNSDHFIFRAAYVAYFRCLNIVALSKDFNYPEDQIAEATLHFLLFQKKWTNDCLNHSAKR